MASQITEDSAVITTRRRQGACAHCRQKKIKCDGARPVCRQCSRFGRRDCSYPEPLPRRKRRPRVVESAHDVARSAPPYSVPELLASDSDFLHANHDPCSSLLLDQASAEALWESLALGSRIVFPSELDPEPNDQSGTSFPESTTTQLAATTIDVLTQQSNALPQHTSADPWFRSGSTPVFAQSIARTIQIMKLASQQTRVIENVAHLEAMLCEQHLFEVMGPDRTTPSTAHLSYSEDHQKYLKLSVAEIGGVLQYATLSDIESISQSVFDHRFTKPSHVALIGSVLANGCLIHIAQNQHFVLQRDLLQAMELFQLALNQRAALLIEPADELQLQALMAMMTFAEKCALRVMPSLISHVVQCFDALGFDSFRSLSAESFSQTSVNATISRIFWAFCSIESRWKTCHGRLSAMSHLMTKSKDSIKPCQLLKLDPFGWYEAQRVIQDLCYDISDDLHSGLASNNAFHSAPILLTRLEEWRKCLPEPYQNLHLPRPDYHGASDPVRRAGIKLSALYFELKFVISKTGAPKHTPESYASLTPPSSSSSDVAVAEQFLAWTSHLNGCDLVMDLRILHLGLAVTCEVIASLLNGVKESNGYSCLAHAHVLFVRASYVASKDSSRMLRAIKAVQMHVTSSSSPDQYSS